MLYALTNISITSEASSIFSWNKEQWKANKIFFSNDVYFYTI